MRVPILSALQAVDIIEAREDHHDPPGVKTVKAMVTFRHHRVCRRFRIRKFSSNVP
jgi:hypothetical protein